MSSTTDRAARAVVALQQDLPVTERPFAEAARAVGLTEAQLLKSAAQLASAGVLRRIGAFLQPRTAGIQANALVAWEVRDELVESVGPQLAAFAEVSHCYERPRLPGFSYNVYTMIHASSEEKCGAAIQRMAEQTGIAGYQVLRTKRELKRGSPQYFADQGGRPG